MRWSSLDLDNFNRRRAVEAGVKHQASANAVEDESELHAQIKDYCRQRGWLVESGSMAHKTKRRVGEVDLHIFMTNGRYCGVEAKSKTGKPTPDQLATIAWLHKLGHHAFVCDNIVDFENEVAKI